MRQIKEFVSTVVLLLVVIFLVWVLVQKPPTILYHSTSFLRGIVESVEAEFLFEILLADIDHDLKAGEPMPTLMREKLLWVQAERRKGTLEIFVHLLSEYPTAFMISQRGKDRNYIAVSLPKMRELTRDYKDKESKKRIKNFFIVCLIHESLHLDDTKLWNTRKKFQLSTLQDDLEEEAFIFAITSKSVVRPLREAGKVISVFDNEMDDTLQACNDEWRECPRFMNQIKRMYPQFVPKNQPSSK